MKRSELETCTDWGDYRTVRWSQHNYMTGHISTEERSGFLFYATPTVVMLVDTPNPSDANTGRAILLASIEGIW